MKNIENKRSFFIKEIEQNKLISKKYRKICKTLNYIEHFLFYSYRNYKFCDNIKICAITARIKKCKSITKKKERKPDKIVLFAKPKLNSKEVLISEALIDSNISHDDFVLVMFQS